VNPMAEQKKGTTSGNTEKTVHDLTKQEDLTRILDQSLRALQEMEQRLQMLEQELGSIGVRPGQGHAARLQPQQASGGQQYIGAPNPHRYHQPLVSPFAVPGAGSPPEAAWAQGSLAAWGPNARGFPQQGDAFGPGTGAGFNPLSLPSMPSMPGMHSVPQMNPFQGPPSQSFGQPSMLRGSGVNPLLAMGAGPDAQTGIPGGTGAPVSQAMQVGQPGMMSSGGTRTKDFSEMAPQVRQPSMDVVDCNSEFLIHWELPGVKKENLDIMVTDKSLILNAKAFPELDDGIVVHSERPPVVYRRTIPFETEVDMAKAKANLKDGVLTIHLPKRSPSNGPKRLDVAYG
jgi:HSP20 family protein